MGVFSEADAELPFVRDVDEAVSIGPARSSESYLDGAKLIGVAKAHGCDAVHPGWGFLSEREDFAAAVAAAGLLWIGPTAESIRRLGDKEAAKNTARGLAPLLEGGGGRGCSDKELEEAARQLGYPVLLKAACGGGGRGQRVVRKDAEWREALEGARKEAKNAFGDEGLIVERYVERGRHVEVQVLGDVTGKVAALGDRDCSVQRRRQKLVEESPVWWMSAEQRRQMASQAEAVCARAGYHTTGTVEFLVDLDNGRHYFLEVNTRLQVEHTVTEEVLGIDLVRLQILTARGAPLSSLSLKGPAGGAGHALQVRLCAEDEELNPSVGRLAVCRWPPGVRLEAGVEKGSVVGPHYDSMVAKLIVTGPDREQCVARAVAALTETRLAGEVTINVPLLMRVLLSPEFAGNTHTTDWLRGRAAASEPARPEDAAVLAAVASHCAARPGAHRAGVYRNVAKERGGRLLLRSTDRGGQLLRLRYGESGLLTSEDDPSLSLALAVAVGGGWWRAGDGRLVEVGEWAAESAFGQETAQLWAAAKGVEAGGRVHRFAKLPRAEWHRGTQADPRQEEEGGEGGEGAGAGGAYVTTMPATVLALAAAEGARVSKGDTVLIMESMKMEIKLRAHTEGHVSYLVAAGQQVKEGTRLLVIKQKE